MDFSCVIRQRSKVHKLLYIVYIPQSCFVGIGDQYHRDMDLRSELRPFVLSDITFTGTRIGAGAYSSVDEVAISVCGAAKQIHPDRSEISDDDISKVSTQFVKECQLMSTLRHPNIVQFLGVCFFDGSQLPVLVMERLLTSLHDLLAPETQPPPGTPSPLSFFKLDLKCSVLHNVASGLDYLHHQTPPIIHRDLSARNILLNWRLVGKIADLGVAHSVLRMRDAATITKAPGASIYMPPEAIAPAESNDEKSKCDASIDVFSLGVVTIFTVSETFPCDPLEPTYIDEDSGVLTAHTELQPRSQYMQNVHTQLHACGQPYEDHPLIQLIEQCLHNIPAKRPNIREILGLLEEARAGIRDEESEVELVKALQNQPRNQVSLLGPRPPRTAWYLRYVYLSACAKIFYHVNQLDTQNKGRCVCARVSSPRIFQRIIGNVQSSEFEQL